MSEPVADALYGPLIIRLAIGVYFLLAGLAKLDHIQTFIEAVQGFKILPTQFAAVYAILLPYVEVGVGVLLILGIWTTLAAFLSSLMLVSYIVAIGIFPHSSSELFNKDFILLAGTLSLMCTGAGALSVDRFRKNG